MLKGVDEIGSGQEEKLLPQDLGDLERDDVAEQEDTPERAAA